MIEDGLQKAIEMAIRDLLLSHLIARDCVVNNVPVSAADNVYSPFCARVGATVAKQVGLDPMQGEAMASEYLDRILSDAERFVRAMRSEG